MRHLVYVIHFTGRFEEMRKFYEWGLRLPLRRAEKDWVEFDTAGASIALHRMKDPAKRGAMLRFVTSDLDAAIAELRGRGLEADGEVVKFRGGRLASFCDADGNPLSLIEPANPVPSGSGPALETLIVNVADMVAATAFYRDRFGLTVLLQQPWWTELDTGATKLSLHPRVAPTDELSHNAQPIVVGFDVPNLEALGEELEERDLSFSGGPVDQRYGRFAEVTDPDGNVVLFRRSDPRAPLEPDHGDSEAEVAAYENAPARGQMRKPVKKIAKATSRVVVKPAYRAKQRAVKKASAKPARSQAGRASARPGAASGRQPKAERRSATRKKTAVASASRRKPVKRAVAKRSRGRS